MWLYSETFQHNLAASATPLDPGMSPLQMIRIDAGNAAGRIGDQRAVIPQCRYAAHRVDGCDQSPVQRMRDDANRPRWGRQERRIGSWRRRPHAQIIQAIEANRPIDLRVPAVKQRHSIHLRHRKI
jgi:hypothetical protein